MIHLSSWKVFPTALPPPAVISKTTDTSLIFLCASLMALAITVPTQPRMSIILASRPARRLTPAPRQDSSIEIFPLVEPGWMLSIGMPKSSHLFSSSRKHALLFSVVQRVESRPQDTLFPKAVPNNSTSSSAPLHRLTAQPGNMRCSSSTHRATKKGGDPTEVVSVRQEALSVDPMFTHLLLELGPQVVVRKCWRSVPWVISASQAFPPSRHGDAHFQVRWFLRKKAAALPPFLVARAKMFGKPPLMCASSSTIPFLRDPVPGAHMHAHALLAGALFHRLARFL